MHDFGQNFRAETDTDAILVVTWDMPGRSMNVIDETVLDELEALVERVKTDDDIRGVVITSAKPAFCAGADLAMLEAACERYRQARRSDEEAATRALQQETARLGRVLRALETCGKSVAAAINGTALGGGFEICLASHYRVAADTATSSSGCPSPASGCCPAPAAPSACPASSAPRPPCR
jgi:3-hydroxyacyl-CoA dehydrogenase / enoyl-CoA hydratase / 3-hydroxybutyryl-CoA epimerase